MHGLHLLLIWVGCVVAYLYLVAPIQIRFTQKLRADTDFEPVELFALQPEAAQYLWAIQQALEAEGFETVGHFSWNNPTPNIFPLLTLYTDRVRDIQAVSAMFYTVSAQGVKITARYVEFITRYQDGTVLLTTNNGVFGTFKRSPNHHTLRLQKQQNPNELLAIHCRRMARTAAAAIEAVPAVGAEMSTYKQRTTESYDRQVAFGRLSLDRSLGAYRPTWKGAYLMTWSQLWPMKAFGRAQAEREAEAELLSLGGGQVGAHQVQ